MKATLLLLAPIALLASCSQNQGQAAAPAAAAANPYGIPTTDAYNPDAAPYQPIDPINPPAMASTPVPPTPTYSAPTYNAPAPSPAASGGQHMIQKGDTLWGISRRYNVSVDALKQANGLATDTIVEGRSLIIPGR